MGTNVCPGSLRTRSSTSLPYQGDPLEVCCGSRLLEEGPGHSQNFAECWLLWEKIVGQSGLVGILASTHPRNPSLKARKFSDAKGIPCLQDHEGPHHPAGSHLPRHGS